MFKLSQEAARHCEECIARRGNPLLSSKVAWIAQLCSQRRSYTIIMFLCLFTTACQPTHHEKSKTKRQPASIEHISRQGIKETYAYQSSMPYVENETQVEHEEVLFEQDKLNHSPLVLQEKLEKQEEIDRLAKLKRSGRLTQKEYNDRVKAFHAKNKPGIQPNVEKKQTTVGLTSPSILQPTKKPEPLPKSTPTPSKLPKIEEITIDDDGDIFDE